ncbi:hypothetical protein FHETE_9992 [Fusarium heterosporum]|uniref:BZIP domain-containing protein n=1 Tax=Fusarium heterosporum TaxID=42747 RepID=A0A8H5WD96_FUSHE|nr:hypothetical protein FHETE_9992 [Fusarium heterosporum]
MEELVYFGDSFDFEFPSGATSWGVDPSQARDYGSLTYSEFSSLNLSSSGALSFSYQNSSPLALKGDFEGFSQVPPTHAYPEHQLFPTIPSTEHEVQNPDQILWTASSMTPPQQQQRLSALSGFDGVKPFIEPPHEEKRGGKFEAQKQDNNREGPLGKMSKSKRVQRNEHNSIIKEKTRLTAARFRLRKRNQALTLVSQEETLADRHRDLSLYLDQLKEEVYQLKTRVLLHENCDCTFIQGYIAIEARKVVDHKGSSHVT